MALHDFDFPMTQAAGIRLLILDVDGVMTDGSIIMDHAGRELKAFNVRDGHGIKMLQRADIQIGIITGRSSEVVAARTADLGIPHVIQGALDKSAALDRMQEMTGIPCDRYAYMGDDIIDLPPMRRCRLAFAPGDAHPAVLQAADWVSGMPGGHGAVRQAAEGLLLANDGWPDIVESRYGVTPADCGWAI